MSRARQEKIFRSHVLHHKGLRDGVLFITFPLSRRRCLWNCMHIRQDIFVIDRIMCVFKTFLRLAAIYLKTNALRNLLQLQLAQMSIWDHFSWVHGKLWENAFPAAENVFFNKNRSVNFLTNRQKNWHTFLSGIFYREQAASSLPASKARLTAICFC